MDISDLPYKVLIEIEEPFRKYLAKVPSDQQIEKVVMTRSSEIPENEQLTKEQVRERIDQEFSEWISAIKPILGDNAIISELRGLSTIICTTSAQAIKEVIRLGDGKVTAGLAAHCMFMGIDEVERRLGRG
ncbi:MAG: hypothetical protein KGJ06_05025 [Pseudomonadota bacterium]|nr:hypothetical protein [Pseudomonadota bacterium]